MPVIWNPRLKRSAIRRPHPPLEVRFWSKVRKTDTCWLWAASTDGKGYGLFGMPPAEGKPLLRRAHRFAYELVIGPIGEGLQIDHLCRNHSCVRPDHLEVVTARENARRGLKGVMRTHCSKGHELTQYNTLIHKTKAGSRRVCRICTILRSRQMRVARCG